MSRTTALSASTARRITENASQSANGSLSSLLEAIDRKIKLACTHKLTDTEFSIGHAFVTEEEENNLIYEISKSLRTRGFLVKYNFQTATLRILWK